MLSDGSLFGTLCAVDPEPRTLIPHQADFLVVIARIIATQIERDVETAARLEAVAELRRAYDDLEATVVRRTQELAKANEELKTEIAVRRRADEALQNSEQSFRMMFAENPLPMWVFDLDTLDFLEVNEATVAHYGYSREEFLQMRTTEVRPPDEVPRFLESLAGRGTGLRSDGDWRHRTKAGRIIDVETSAHSMQFAGRRSALVVIEDITERKKAEEALRASEQRFRSIYENAAIGIYRTAPDGSVLMANPALLAMLGYNSLDELAAVNIEEEHGPDYSRDEFRKRMDCDGEILGLEAGWRRRDGSHLHIRESARTLYDNSGAIAYYEGTVEDITERKLAQEQLKCQLERLTALRNIDISITAGLDLHLTLEGILKHVTEQLHVAAADVLLLNPYTQTLEYSAGTGFRSNSIARSRLHMGEGYAGRAALQRQTLSVPNLSDTGDLLRAPLLHGEDFIAYFAVPLIAKGQVKGVLEVFCRTALDPDAEWLAFLETLAGQTAIAVDNYSLFNDLQRSNTELVLAYDTTLEGWSRALDLRDKETEGHSRRVTELTLRLAEALGVSGTELLHARRGALLHDIGKVGIPDSILLKPGPLSDEEWEVMRKHPVYAYELLYPVDFLRSSLDIPYCHHEKWDGTGYPRGLKGEQIPFAARIFAVVDVWDALRSDRPYRAAWSEEKVRDHIRSLAGTHFDARVVNAFLSMDWS